MDTHAWISIPILRLEESAGILLAHSLLDYANKLCPRPHHVEVVCRRGPEQASLRRPPKSARQDAPLNAPKARLQGFFIFSENEDVSKTPPDALKGSHDGPRNFGQAHKTSPRRFQDGPRRPQVASKTLPRRRPPPPLGGLLDASKRLKTPLRRLKTPLRRLKTPLRRLKTPPRWLLDAPRGLQAFRRLQDAPRGLQEASKTVQDRFFLPKWIP